MKASCCHGTVWRCRETTAVPLPWNLWVQMLCCCQGRPPESQFCGASNPSSCLVSWKVMKRALMSPTTMNDEFKGCILVLSDSWVGYTLYLMLTGLLLCPRAYKLLHFEWSPPWHHIETYLSQILTFFVLKSGEDEKERIILMKSRALRSLDFIRIILSSSSLLLVRSPAVTTVIYQAKLIQTDSRYAWFKTISDARASPDA